MFKKGYPEITGVLMHKDSDYVGIFKAGCAGLKDYGKGGGTKNEERGGEALTTFSLRLNECK